MFNNYTQSQDLYIALLSVDSPKYIKRSEIAIHNINTKLKIPIEKINVFRFPPVKKNEVNDSIDLNHITIMKTALEKKYKYALIFEDDVDFEKEADVQFSKAFHNATANYTNWGVLYLGCHSFTPIYKIHDNLYKGFYMTTAHAYIVNKKTMKYITSLDPEVIINKKPSKSTRLNIKQIDINYKIFPKCNPIMIYPSIAYQTEKYRALIDVPFISGINVRKLQNYNNLLNMLLFKIIITIAFLHFIGVYKVNKKIIFYILFMSTYNFIGMLVAFYFN